MCQLKWISIGDFAKVSGVTRQTIYNKMQRGDIHSLMDVSGTSFFQYLQALNLKYTREPSRILTYQQLESLFDIKFKLQQGIIPFKQIYDVIFNDLYAILKEEPYLYENFYHAFIPFLQVIDECHLNQQTILKMANQKFDHDSIQHVARMLQYAIEYLIKALLNIKDPYLLDITKGNM